MEEHKQKAYDLFRSAELKNIELGIELIKSLDLDISLEDFEALYYRQFLSEPDDPPLAEKISSLFYDTRLNIGSWQYYNHQLRAYLPKKLPTFLFELSQIEELTIEENRLTKLPAGISNLKQLRSLRINNNHITAIDYVITELKELKELYIHENPIIVLPSYLFDLNLETLSIWGLLIKYIPKEIYKLRKLYSLSISGHLAHNLDYSRFPLLRFVSFYNEYVALEELKQKYPGINFENCKGDCIHYQ